MSNIFVEIVKIVENEFQNGDIRAIANAIMETVTDPNAVNILADIQLAIKVFKDIEASIMGQNKNVQNILGALMDIHS